MGIYVNKTKKTLRRLTVAEIDNNVRSRAVQAVSECLMPLLLFTGLG